MADADQAGHHRALLAADAHVLELDAQDIFIAVVRFGGGGLKILDEAFVFENLGNGHLHL